MNAPTLLAWTSPGLRDANLRIALFRMAEDARARGDGPIASILDTAIRTLDVRLSAPATPESAIEPAATPVGRTVTIGGRRTWLKLEPEFWQALEGLAACQGCTVGQLCDAAREAMTDGNTASAVRVYVLRRLLTERIGAKD